MSKVRMCGDIAIASFEPLVLEEIPTYDAIKDGAAEAIGWMTTPICVSVRYPLANDTNDGLFGALDLNKGTLSGNVTFKDGTVIDSEPELNKLFADEDHALVRPVYQDGHYEPQGRRKVLFYQEMDAFALVPGRRPTKGNNRDEFAPDIKSADVFAKSQQWRLFRGLFLRRPRY